MLDVEIFLPGEDVLSHHVLVPATTGRGKSNLTSVVLWNLVDKDYCGILVLDPHDEYYGRTGIGLKNHPKKEQIDFLNRFVEYLAWSLKFVTDETRAFPSGSEERVQDYGKEYLFAMSAQKSIAALFYALQFAENSGLEELLRL
jgi:DNA helicase HerA-like ATPase